MTKTPNRRRAIGLPRLATLFSFACCLSFGASQAIAQAPVLYVKNHSSLPRLEWLRGSVPFAKGKVRGIPAMNVDGRPTSWRVLQRWPDGSTKIAQAQWLDVLHGSERIRRPLRDGTKKPAPFAFHPATLEAIGKLRVATSVRDIDGVPYEAIATATTGEEFEVIEQTEAVLTVRTRNYHRNAQGKGIGRDFLSQTCYMTFFSGLPYALVDVVIANDYKGADSPKSKDPNLYPLGDVAIKSLDLVVLNGQALTRYASQNHIGAHAFDVFGKGSTWIKLLGQSYLADAQAKRWRIAVFFDSKTHTDLERHLWRIVTAAQSQFSTIPVADLASWKRTQAFGIHGGPIDPASPKVLNREIARRVSVLNNSDFGPFGSWGDYKHSWTTGTHRNGFATEHAILSAQSGDDIPLQVLEATAWQQSCRPYQLWKLRVEPHHDIYMWSGLPYNLKSTSRISQETLGRYDLVQNKRYERYRKGVRLNWAHGWNGYDMGHFTCDQLFDYHQFTGDWRCYDEIVMLAECGMGAARNKKYWSSKSIATVRGEGWLAQALIKAWFVTGDDRYKHHLQERFRKVIDVVRHKTHPSRAMSIYPAHPLTHFPTPNTYIAPWHHAPVIYGYMAAWRHWGDATARTIAHDVVHTIVYSWVKNWKDPKRGVIPDALRYYTPMTYNKQNVPANIWDSTKNIGVRYGSFPLGGVHDHFVGGLDLLLEDAYNKTERDVLIFLRKKIGATAPNDERWRWGRFSALREPPK